MEYEWYTYEEELTRFALNEIAVIVTVNKDKRLELTYPIALRLLASFLMPDELRGLPEHLQRQQGLVGKCMISSRYVCALEHKLTGIKPRRSVILRKDTNMS